MRLAAAAALLAGCVHILISSGKEAPQQPAAGASGTASPSVPWRPAGRDAREECKTYFLTSAHDPASVEWVDEVYWPIKLLDDDIWRVQMLLRARNGFGAIRLIEYQCQVQARMGGTAAGWTRLSIDRTE